MSMIQINRQQTAGFALLMTLLVVTVVVSITLTVIELSIKQLNLSVTARDSEIAFHAANAGMECVRYVRRAASTTLEALGTPIDNIDFSCFNRTQELELASYGIISATGDGEVRRYVSEVTWGTGDRCSVIDMFIMVVPDTEPSDMVVSDLDTEYSGFPAGDTKTCSPGATCTVAEVVGYNRACTDISLPGTVRREILLEF